MPVGQAQRTKFAPGKKSVSPQSVTYQNLTISVSIAFDTEAPPYRWDITAHFDWNGAISQLGGEDFFAIAWAHGLALHSASAWGKYTDPAAHALDTHPDDAQPNVGTSFAFHEQWKACGNCQLYYANYGWLNATIKETVAHNEWTNVMVKYFHTYSNGGFNLGFSASPSLVISISPTLSQWNLADSTSFLD